MYQIKCDENIIHDSRSNNVRVIEPKCEMELNKTGTLSFRIQPTHPCFDLLKKHKSELSLYQDGEWMFTGRILNDETDIYGYKTVEVEGMLGYLLDSIQRAKEYHITGSDKIKQYLTDVLSIHNEQVETSKQFAVGNIRLDDESEQLYKISSYKDTLTTINEDLTNTFGGYFFASVRNGSKHLDYLGIADFPINTQTIQLGKNILTLNKRVKGEDIATVIIPLGKTIDSTGESNKKITISDEPYSKDGSIIHEAGTDYIYDEDAVAEFGRITKVIDWNDVEEPSNLLTKAKEQLNYYKYSDMSLELSVFDLHLLNVNVQSLRVGQKIRVVSRPHNIDLYMIVQKMSLDIDRPDNSTITLVTEERSAVNVSSGSGGGSISSKIVNVDNTIKTTPYLGGDSYVDMSGYATITAVNAAFNELGMLIGGM